MPETVLVVPCYNEAGRLNADAFTDFVGAHPDIGFLFVDDGSADGTWDLLSDLAERAPASVQALKLDANGGKAEAVRRGMLQAMAGEARYVGFWDADLATPLTVVPEFSRVLNERPDCIAVFGARVRMMGRSIHRRASRHFLGRLFATFASLLLKVHVYDTQCGAKLFRSGPDTAHAFSEPFLSKWIFDVEVLARLIERDAADVYEYPLPCWRDEGGSKIRLLDYVRVPWDLARIRRHYS